VTNPQKGIFNVMTVFAVKRDFSNNQLMVNDHIVTGKSVFGWQNVERYLTYFMRNPFVKVFQNHKKF
jgi:hypothetical protein